MEQRLEVDQHGVLAGSDEVLVVQVGGFQRVTCSSEAQGDAATYSDQP
jgi:hypothetical protein